VPDPVTTPTPWGRLPQELPAALGARLESTVDEVARTVSRSIPAFAEIEDPKFERDVHAAVRVAVERFLDLVGTDQPALPPQVRETFVALGAAEARDDRSPEILLGALRIASRLLLRNAARALGEARPVGAEELLDLSDAVTAYVDELAAASTDGYALQVREQAGETDRRRRLLGELVLRGGAAESAVMAAAAAIGWRRLDALVPVLLPTEHARDARFRYGADAVVIDRESDAVLLLRAGPRASRAQLVDALRGRGAVVGPTQNWAQAPEGVRLAELTADLMPDDGAATGPVFADDHLALLALRGERGALGVLSARRLAPCAGLAPGVRGRFLHTLHSWLRHWGSRTDVAAELFIHPQTVSYRIRRLRDLLGDDLDDATARFELQLVLTDRLGR
jgi:hypothetical protein